MHYIILVLFFALLAGKRKAGNVAFVFYMVTLILFAFFTREGSTDYSGYVEYYKCSISLGCDSTGFEKSFSYVSQISNFVTVAWGLELTFLFYIVAGLSLKVYLIKNQSQAFGAAMLAFVCQAYFVHDLTQIRASLAIAILWYAYFFWTQQKIVRACLFIVLASIFHVSALMGFFIVFIKRISTRFLLILIIPAALTGQFLANGGITSIPGLSIERLDIYISALGSIGLVSSQFNVYVVAITVVAFLGYKNGLEEWTDFELLGINSMLFGVILYLSFYFVPIVPVRLLELFSCLYPFVVAATYNSSRSKMVKVSLVLLFIGLFVNTAIRNNTRFDLVFPWQAIHIEYMTDLQQEQFIRMSK
ncbi:MAG: EpsG family protein [Bdellovibrionales bacterium]